jgi:hypothetical protein
VLGIDVIAKEGLDIPDLNTLIFATPAGMEIEQPVGRILRKFHKTLSPLVFDLVDNTGNYVKHSSERDKWYTDEGYILNELTIDLDHMTGETKEQIRDYIQNKQKVVIKRRTAGRGEKGTKEDRQDEDAVIFDACVLDNDDGPAVPVGPVKKAKEVRKDKIKPEEGLNLKVCRLDNYCPPIPEVEPDILKDTLGKCLI